MPMNSGNKLKLIVYHNYIMFSTALVSITDKNAHIYKSSGTA